MPCLLGPSRPRCGIRRLRRDANTDDRSGNGPVKATPDTTLPRALVNQILRQAQRDPEREVCGLISGRGGLARRCYPVPNTATDPRVRYEMDARCQITAQRAMRERGEDLWAIYHSHPDTPATPSARDLERLAHPGALYLIVSLGTKGVLEMRAFRQEDTTMVPVELTII